MKHPFLKSFALAALFAATANFARADITLFHDDFEGTNLVQWIGKSGAAHSGQLVADPLNPANHVLTFGAVNFGGDMFSATPLNLSRPRHYVLSFDFLGTPDASNPAREIGGFIGFADAPTGDSRQFWIGGTFPAALTVPPPVATTLIADGQWHHYEIDFTSVITANGLSTALLMLEDWFGFDTGIPGDAFFDNIRVVGLLDLNSILGQIPCSGPAPGKKWKNHGAYVSAVSKLAQSYVAADLISEEEALEITTLAGQSTCGGKK